MAWIKMVPLDATGSPGRRAQLQNSMVYDQARDVFVVFTVSDSNGRQQPTLSGLFPCRLDPPEAGTPVG
jgi:hypothetical protein